MRIKKYFLLIFAYIAFNPTTDAMQPALKLFKDLGSKLYYLGSQLPIMRRTGMTPNNNSDYLVTKVQKTLQQLNDQEELEESQDNASTLKALCTTMTIFWAKTIERHCSELSNQQGKQEQTDCYKALSEEDKIDFKGTYSAFVEQGKNACKHRNWDDDIYLPTDPEKLRAILDSILKESAEADDLKQTLASIDQYFTKESGQQKSQENYMNTLLNFGLALLEDAFKNALPGGRVDGLQSSLLQYKRKLTEEQVLEIFEKGIV